jgi:hypothetical protein
MFQLASHFRVMLANLLVATCFLRQADPLSGITFLGDARRPARRRLLFSATTISRFWVMLAGPPAADCFFSHDDLMFLGDARRPARRRLLFEPRRSHVFG